MSQKKANKFDIKVIKQERQKWRSCCFILRYICLIDIKIPPY
jgi:hypothetical protein